MKHTTRSRGLLCALLLGCSAEGGGSDGTNLSVSDVKAPLALGANGPEVRALHDFLRDSGYFENAKLRESFPRWFPVVAQAPTPDSYDQVMESAVLAFQRLNGLEQTGVADAATLALMATPRCGVPDMDLSQVDERDKFFLKDASYTWGKTSLTYGFTTTFSAQQKAAVASSLNAWAAMTNLSFSENTSTPSAADIVFKIGVIDNGCASTVLACTYVNASLGQMSKTSTIFSSSYTWSGANPPPSGQVDLFPVSLHETGHALGLDHSNLVSGVMYPTSNGQRVIQTDDAIAMSLKYSPWQTLSGTAIELAAGPDGIVYKLGETSVTGGRQMARWSEASQSWSVVSNSIGATQIALGYDDDLWFAKTDGTVWRWTTEDLTQQVTPPSGMADLGIASGVPWALTGTTTSGCGKKTYKLSGSSWTNMGGCGVEIAVPADGRPWVLDQNGNIKRYDGSGTSASDWVTVTGTASHIAASNVASDVGLAVWKSDYSAEEDNTLIRAWNQQRSLWETPRLGNTGGRLAVGPKGQPWSLDVWSYQVYRQRRD
ncbi:MAG: matrixin family metalloprotease [Polyangiaceae bacterium]